MGIRNLTEPSCNLHKSTFRLGGRAYCPQSSDRANPRPTRLRFATYLRESVPGLPMPGRGKEGFGKFRGVRKFVSRWWTMSQVLERSWTRRTSPLWINTNASDEKSY